MIRHFIKVNLTDPLSTKERQTSKYTQYFSGDNTASQINYLEYEPISATSSLRVHVYVGGVWVAKTEDTDFTRDATNLKITWTNYTPPSGNDNIRIVYDHIKGWVYDDIPNYSSSYFPRISVEDIRTDIENMGMGTYSNFTSGVGDFHKARYNVGIYAAEGMKVTIGSRTYQNADIVRYLAQQLKTAFHNNRNPCYWKFHDWKVTAEERVTADEESGYFRYNLVLDVQYWDSGGGG
jgi:hypothetical protein